MVFCLCLEGRFVLVESDDFGFGDLALGVEVAVVEGGLIFFKGLF